MGKAKSGKNTSFFSSFVSIPYLLTFAAWFLYAGLSLSAPILPEAVDQLNLTIDQIRLLRIVVLPFVLVIWLLALISTLTVKRYALSLKRSKAKEFRAFNFLAVGAGLLLAFQILSTLFQALHDSFGNALLSQAVLTNQVSTIALAITSLLTFSFLAVGSISLLGTLKTKISLVMPLGLAVIIGLLIEYIYVLGIFANERRAVPTDPYTAATFGFSDNLIFGFVSPVYLISWIAGVLAVLVLYIFAGRVKGVIYRRMARTFATGLVSLIGFSIIFQFLDQTNYFIELQPVLLVISIFGLIGLLIIGFYALARGASQLRSIEEK